METAERSIVIGPERNGDIVFTARLAELSGDLTREEIGGGEALVFHASGDKASWEFRVEKPGYFKAELMYSLKDGTEDVELELVIGERVKRCSLRSSGSLDRFHSDTVTIAVPQSGNQRLIVRAPKTATDGLGLKEIRFMPISAKLTTGGH